MTKKNDLKTYVAGKAEICQKNCRIDYNLYDEYGVKRACEIKTASAYWPD